MNSVSGNKPSLSIVLIVKDEEARLGACLERLGFADEVIVADTDSSDGTVRLALDFGAKVVHLPFRGYGPTKQAAIEQAKGDWILSLDADEIISGDLANEILDAIASSKPFDGYRIPRHSRFLGREIRWGGWGRDKVLRLFKHGRGRFTPEPVHEKIIVRGPVGELRYSLEHNTDPSFPHYIKKIDRYSTLAAEKIIRKGGKGGVVSAFAHAFAIFVRKYLFQMGWRDGLHGALLAVSTAYATFLRYIKAELIRRGEAERIAPPRRDDTSTGDIEQRKEGNSSG